MVAAALAGKCEDTASVLVGAPDFEQSFREGMTAEAQSGFVRGLRSAGTTDEAFIAFATDYWTPRLNGYMQDSYVRMVPALEAWIVGSVGCKRLKQIGKQRPFVGWEALTEAEQTTLQQNQFMLPQHPAMQEVMGGLETFMADGMPAFLEAATAASTPPPSAPPEAAPVEAAPEPSAP